MTKSELIEHLANQQAHLLQKDVELSVRLILDRISQALGRDERVEIRGFGSFSLHHRPARVGRNPKTGEEVPIDPRRVLTFKPSQVLKEKVDAGHSKG